MTLHRILAISDGVTISLAAALVAVILLVLFRKRLKRFWLKLPGAEVGAEGHAEKKPGDAINRNVVSTAGSVEARNEIGGHAINEGVRAKGTVSATATPAMNIPPKA
jgi:hypothetical protein